jgi:hypothetical protein
MGSLTRDHWFDLREGQRGGTSDACERTGYQNNGFAYGIALAMN